MRNLLLKTGGILEYHKWNSDTRSYDIEDASDSAIWYLNNSIKFDDDIILKDLFLLIQKNMDSFLPVFNNWIDEYTELALSTDANRTKSTDPDEIPIDYLELHWFFILDLKNKYDFEIPAWPRFHGISVADRDTKYYKKGEVVRWAADYSNIQDLVYLPLKLKNSVDFYISEKSKKIGDFEFPTESYTLYQVIQSVMYEISWSGSPEQSKEFNEYILDMVKKIKNGEEEIFSMDDLLSDKDLNKG